MKMSKTLPIIATVIIGVGLVAGYNLSNVDDELERKETSNNKTIEEKIVDENAWKDITKLKIPEGEISDYPTNAKGWIAMENSVFNEPSDQDSKLKEAGLDEYYKYYLEAIRIPTDLSIIKVKGISIEKDFNNIEKLAAIIEEGQKKRTENVDPNRPETFSLWEAPGERLIQASNYLKQLFNDLNVAINKDGNGELFEVAYQVNGQKTAELEAFIRGSFIKLN
jgi:hypothetical protein